jgi:hypothetical protein
MTAIDLKEALINPAGIFKTPEDVLKANLAPEDQIKILELWEHDLHLLQACDEENMPGADLQLLRRIHECLLQLRNPRAE